MNLYTSAWGPQKTFKMIPITMDCPYIECIFNPEHKVLAVISKDKKQGMVMVPKLDMNGVAEPVKTGKGMPGKDSKMERKTLDTFQEYYIEDEEEIKAFIKLFADNSEQFDYKAYFIKPETVSPKVGNIQMQEPVVEETK